jgi:hypothetical protein
MSCSAIALTWLRASAALPRQVATAISSAPARDRHVSYTYAVQTRPAVQSGHCMQAPKVSGVTTQCVCGGLCCELRHQRSLPLTAGTGCMSRHLKPHPGRYFLPGPSLPCHATAHTGHRQTADSSNCVNRAVCGLSYT